MFRSNTISLGSFKSILRRHKQHPDGLPLYNELSKQWICRDAERWWLLDASGQQLPRVAEVAARYMCGKHRPDHTPGMIAGDNVVIINCKDVVMTGDDWVRIPITWQTNYPGGKYRIRLSDMYERDPCLLMFYYIKKEISFYNMRKLKMRAAPIEKAWLYEDAIHPHGDKNPRPLNWSDPLIKRESWRSPSFQRRWSPNEYMR